MTPHHAGAFPVEPEGGEPRRLRILHVFRAPSGGLFRHVLDLARGQSERGHAVGILCDSSTGGNRAEALLAGITPHLALGVRRVPMHRNPHPLDLAGVATMWGIARKLRPDVVHGHGSKGGLYARLVPSGPHVVRAYAPHGGSFNFQPGTLRHDLYMAAERLLARRTDVFLFESHDVAARFRAWVGETDRAAVRVVHNGLAPAEFEPVAPAAEPLDLMTVGELRPGKGVDTLIDALALLRREHDMRLTLLAVGSGPEEGALKARAQAAGIADAIIFVPGQPIRQVLGRARVMVMPSHAESLPYVVLEAAAAGQPLLATRVGGIPEIFGPLQDELVPPADAAALAKGILRKTAEPAESRLMKAEQLRGFVQERFALATMVEGALAGYAAALAARLGAPSGGAAGRSR